MASAEFTEESKQKRPNVQVGDPFLEKLLLEACLEAMKTGAIVAIQDMGAAGLTSSSCEMGSRGGVGIEIDLDLRPAARNRHDGLRDAALRIAGAHAAGGRKGPRRRSLPACSASGASMPSPSAWSPTMASCACGITARSSPRFRIRALADEAPRYDRPHNVKPYRNAPARAARAHPASNDLNADLLRLVGVARPLLQALDLGAVRLHGPHQHHRRARLRRRRRAHQGDRHFDRDVARRQRPLLLSRSARRREAGGRRVLPQSRDTGAVPVAATNNLNFGNPERPEIMAQLVEAIEGIAEACAFFETPITGGNVSLYNETLGEGIYPTPVLGIVGLMKTAAPVADSVPSSEGAAMLLLGGLGECDALRFGGTQYAKVILNQLWGLPPQLDMDYEKRVHDCDARDPRRGPGRIRARSERWRPGGGAEPNARTGRNRRAASTSIPTICGRNSRFSTKRRRAFWSRPRDPDAYREIAVRS